MVAVARSGLKNGGIVGERRQSPLLFRQDRLGVFPLTALKCLATTRRMLRLCSAVALVVALIFSRTARAEVTFALSFPDVASHTNQNWDDPTYGSLARAELQTVLDQIGREFAETATIQLSITSSMTTLYAAAANYASDVLQPAGFRD